METLHKRRASATRTAIAVLKVVEGQGTSKINFQEEKTMNEKIYLAYGSNMNTEQMALRCPTAKVLGTAVLKDYRLVFRAFASIEPHEGAETPVLLWIIKPLDELALDRYEGYPSHYRKETVEVELDGETVEAMVYVMNPIRPYATPSCYYYSTILEGYKEFGLDEQYLKDASDFSAKEGYHA